MSDFYGHYQKNEWLYGWLKANIEQPYIDGLDGAWDCKGGGPRLESWQELWKNGWLIDFQRKGAELDPRVDLSWQMSRKGRK